MPSNDSRKAATAATGVAYRLIAAAVVLGCIGADVALVFDGAVTLAQSLLLQGIAGYAPPEVGTLTPVAAEMPLASRGLLPVVTVLGALISGILVFRFAPAAEGHGTDAAIAAYHHEPGEVTLPRLVSLLQLGEPISFGVGNTRLVKIEVATDASLDGATIEEGVGSVPGATVVAVMRGGEVLIPRGPTVLHAQDELVLLVTPAALATLQAEPPDTLVDESGRTRP